MSMNEDTEREILLIYKCLFILFIVCVLHSACYCFIQNIFWMDLKQTNLLIGIFIIVFYKVPTLQLIEMMLLF